MLNLFETVYEEAVPLSRKVSYLESACHYSSFSDPDSKSLAEVNAKIRIYLGSHTKRFDGLVLLKQVLDQCSNEVFAENAISWAQMALKVLEKSGENIGSRMFACKVLCSILENVRSWQSLTKSAANAVLPGVLEALICVSVDDEWIEYAMSCLAVCLKYFPGPCGLKKNKIEGFLLSMLDNWDRRNFEPLATCISYLPACGSENSSKVSNGSWTQQLKTFINTLHSILNSLIIGTDISEVRISSEFSFPPLPEDPFLSALKQAYRFKAFGQCLAKMLVSKTLHEVAIPVDDLLSFISRTFSIAPSHFIQSPFILSVIPILHLAGLTILESLVLSCDQYLLCSFHHVNKLLIQVLKANEYRVAGLNSQFCVVRCATYRVFQAYLQKQKFNSGIGADESYLSSMMINDIKPIDNQVKLSEQKPCSMNFVAPDKKRRLGYSLKTCIEALKALKAYIAFGGLSIEIHKDIYNAVKAIIISLKQNPLDIPFPYGHNICEFELCNLLRVSAIKVFKHQQSLVHSSLALFSCTMEDSYLMVYQLAQEELNVLNLMIRSCRDYVKPVDHVETTDTRGSHVENDKILFLKSARALISDEDNDYDKVIAEDMQFNDGQINAGNSTPSQGSVSEDVHSSDEEDITEELVSCSKSNKIVDPSQFVNSDYFSMNNECDGHIKQNGINSEECESDLEFTRKRHLSDSNSEIPPYKKVAINDEEEEKEVNSMLLDFAPTSPDDNDVL